MGESLHQPGRPVTPRHRAHENHETTIKNASFPAGGASDMLGEAISALTGNEELVMRWETPQAVDLRFGMEITMYIANR
jgi:coenzyme PQQ precursor peptide PqqA